MPRRNSPHTLVVGGTRGIGREVVVAFADAGHVVSVVGQHDTGDGWPKQVRVWRTDLARAAALPGLVQEIFKVNGPFQSLVFLQRFRGEGDSWQRELDVSLTATRLMIDLTRNKFISHEGKAIVILGSVAGQFVAEEQPVGYHVAKGALRQLMRYYACALGPAGIRVNSVSPGVILKPEAESFYRKNKELVALYERIAPLRRFGRASEVASVVRFLCGKDAAFITGQDIVVDGGISLVWQASLARQLVPIRGKRPRGSVGRQSPAGANNTQRSTRS
ncbi:MAG TPA: SDR family oxidoreductase [Candidatus Binatia bacterium]|jgi:NAD(P)-dependent dehydrogenase (short-subunit alcohol dehydrogenase family)|nr:SDR family oxidoreductase [Candidatus Binatia bacterium]